MDGLKADIEKYRTDAEKLPGVQKELETAQAGLEAGKKDSWKVKYDAIKEEFEGYKSKQTKKETRAAKESAYRNQMCIRDRLESDNQPLRKDSVRYAGTCAP